MRRSVFIAIPAYTGMVHFDTMQSLIADSLTLATRGDKVKIQGEKRNPNIEVARAILVARFLASDATDFIARIRRERICESRWIEPGNVVACLSANAREKSADQNFPISLQHDGKNFGTVHVRVE